MNFIKEYKKMDKSKLDQPYSLWPVIGIVFLLLALGYMVWDNYLINQI